MRMHKSAPTILLLAACQALLMTANVVIIGMTGLAGYVLANDKGLATLPVTAFIVGTAITTFPAALWMRRVGRRLGFVTGSGLGICGAALCAVAMASGSFLLLTLGAFLNGSYNAFGQQYRFAAAELVGGVERGRAIALVLAGGIGGAILGPEGTKLIHHMFGTPFFGGYILLVGCGVLAVALQLWLRLLDGQVAHVDAGPARPLRIVVGQRRFIAAVFGAVTGYAVMSFLMTATPLAMMTHHHQYNETVLVIEWHAIAMFAPSFVAGPLLRRFGTIAVMSCGAGLMLGTVAVAAAGTSLGLYWTALVLLGIGWNFLYVGGTTLLTMCYRPSERAAAQGFNDMLVFMFSGAASLLSGVLLERVGWDGMLFATVPFLLLILATLVWVGTGCRAGAATAE